MRFAYDDNGLKIEPSFSGQRGKCPLCYGTVIGKCGEIIVRHWQHYNDRNCDSWKEHETEWHRNWKSEFPKECQEVIIENEGKKHIADIKTIGGVVIEFQNSSISTSTIRAREDFYGNMIWVVNAKTFKDNFKIRSVVALLLRNVEQSTNSELESLQNAYADESATIEKEIEKNENEKDSKFYSIKYETEKLEKLNDILTKAETFTNEVIEKWIKNEWHWDSDTNKITANINLENKIMLQSISKEIRELEIKIESHQKKLDGIVNLENCQIGNIVFKIVQYEQIPTASFRSVRAISRGSRTTLFPEIIEFLSESEFKNFQNRKTQFDIAVDPTNASQFLNQQITDGKNSILSLNKQLSLTRELIACELIQELKKQIQATNEKIVKLNDEWSALANQYHVLYDRHLNLSELRDIDIYETEIEIEKRKNEKRSKIMREKKGLYGFEWKHERKSWQAAHRTIYFDIGEAYLFELLKDGLFKKIEINDFLNNHLSKRK